jgi:ferredoxin
MQELRELAKKLLAEGDVKWVLGWEEGPRGVRPAVVMTPEAADKLVFDPRCVQNLATYLNPRRVHLKKLGKPAIVLKTCDARAVAGLLRESQIKREDVVLIGVRCGGVLADPAGKPELTAETLATRCAHCETRVPQQVDHLVGLELPAPPVKPGDDPMARLEGMSLSERWAFWTEQFERCVRCNACREVCPLCFCERCVQDKSQPQWIETSAHLRGNLAWHLTRALHLAGRCASCGECQRACPADLPLGLLNRKAAEIVARRYNHTVSDDPAVPAPMGAWRPDDPQEFIL